MQRPKDWHGEDKNGNVDEDVDGTYGDEGGELVAAYGVWLCEIPVGGDGIAEEDGWWEKLGVMELRCRAQRVAPWRVAAIK